MSRTVFRNTLLISGTVELTISKAIDL